jgi:hypothetical protein
MTGAETRLESRGKSLESISYVALSPTIYGLETALIVVSGEQTPSTVDGCANLCTFASEIEPATRRQESGLRPCVGDVMQIEVDRRRDDQREGH